MNNELLFLVISLIDIIIVFIAGRLGKSFLFATIATNLILVSTFGAKMITLFGFATNVGNAFYACVFLATHMITEHYGKKEGFKTIPIGLLSIILFLVSSKLVISLSGLPQSSEISTAMETIFQNVPRIAAASMIAYIGAQSLNVWLYNLLHVQSGESFLWLRDNFSNLCGQFLDSILFFTIAFLGVLPSEVLTQAIFTGFLVKMVVGLLGTPFLYLSYRFKNAN